MTPARPQSINPKFASTAKIDEAQYSEMYRRSISDPKGLWAEHGQRIDWIQAFTKVRDWLFGKDDLHIRWFEDGLLNAAANCLDRHLATRADKTVIIWEANASGLTKSVTFAEARRAVCRFANIPKRLGVRIGAIHSLAASFVTRPSSSRPDVK